MIGVIARFVGNWLLAGASDYSSGTDGIDTDIGRGDGVKEGAEVDGAMGNIGHCRIADDPAGEARILIRLPDQWNGKLLVAGAFGTRSEFNGDFAWSDYVV